MKLNLAVCLSVLLSLLSASTAHATTIYQDDFESGALGSAWSTSFTNNGRAVVTGDYQPASGANMLLLDDGINDALYSVSEATLTLDLSLKKNVVLSFKAKALGNDGQTPPVGNFSTTRTFDGVSISADGGVTWRAVQSLATLDGNWQQSAITLDASVTALAGNFGPGFRIRFSEYDNASAPLDGIAIDDVSVTADDDQRTVLELPASVTEGGGPYTGYALVALAPTTPLVLTLSASPTGQLALPATVTIPAGQTYGSFTFSAVDNSLLDFTRTVSVSATAPGVTAYASNISVVDDDVAALSLSLPAQLAEGATASNNATVSLNRAASVSLTVTLTASPANELTLPATVTIPAGQMSVTFTAVAVNDTRLDGNVPVTVTATANGVTSATAQTTTIDNETRTLALTLPTSVTEGATGTGTVSISGTLTAPLDITLTSDNAAAAAVPATVTIAAGATSASFTVTAPDNALRDGTRSVTVQASAATFASASKSLQVRDNDVAAYKFGSLTEIVNVSSAVSVSISAIDVEGNALTSYAGTVSLFVVLPDGTTQPLAPATVSLSGSTGFSGSVTVPAVSGAPLRLRATDVLGNTGDSSAFDVMRVLNLTAADLIWDGTRGRIYASVPSTAPTNTNQVVAIDPVTAQITKTNLVGQSPGQFALTSGGEYLYTILNANGTVARLDPATLGVLSSFSIGVDSSFGTIYAEDICTVFGQPNVVVASRKYSGVSPRHAGVAVYDNGVPRSTMTQTHTGSNVIEPSADPTIYFGYNNETTEFGFRKLKVSATGITEVQVDATLTSGFGGDFRSDGDKVYTNGGAGIDGALMRRVGAFPTSGVVRPDLASNRVYFIEPQSQYSSYYDKIAGYDPASFTLIRRSTMPAAVTSPASFIRWGANGLAFRTSNTVVLITSALLVPSDPPADLKVTMTVAPNPATANAPLVYTTTLTNQGPNISRNTTLVATLSDSQTYVGATASSGTPTYANSVVTLPVGNLAVGATVTLTITTTPLSAGSVTCTASANSTSLDANSADNTAFKLASVGFQTSPDAVNAIRLTVNNLLYDAARGVLWATIPNTVAAPLGKSLVSINPNTGLISDPIAINANPATRCIALSGNGRYLYIGLTDATEVCRFDLTSPTYASIRIPLGLNQWSSASYAEDIEVLDGDGTSFLLTTYGDDGASVWDGTVRRSTRSGIYTVDRIERSPVPGVFLGYDNSDTGFASTKLTVTSSGVSVTQKIGSLFASSFGADIRSTGSLVLSSTGQLVDSSTMLVKANLGLSGRPCTDATNGRAYIVSGAGVYAYDLSTGNPAGNFALPVTSTGDWATDVTRWGADGLAVLGPDKVYIARWSGTVPGMLDTNGNGVADAWEVATFGSLKQNLNGDTDHDGVSDVMEYFFGTSPMQANANPLSFSVAPASVPAANGQPGSASTTVRLTFPRRAGLLGPIYAYEVSNDLAAWNPTTNITETVLSTAVVAGVRIETVQADIACPTAGASFVRLRWLR